MSRLPSMLTDFAAVLIAHALYSACGTLVHA
jgi:hypothetical protein